MTGQNDDRDDAYGQIVFKLLETPANDVNTQPQYIKTIRLFQYFTASH